jgi:Arc/MetJ-type ribon-helix-helix transcriptional regulator
MKIITINVPDSTLDTVEEFRDLGLFQSRSEFFREAVKEHIETLTNLKKEMKMASTPKIITVNFPKEYLDQIEELLPEFYVSKDLCRSEFIRDAGLRLIEKTLAKIRDEPAKITFDEELAEYVYPIIKNDAYKTYKVVK